MILNEKQLIATLTTQGRVPSFLFAINKLRQLHGFPKNILFFTKPLTTHLPVVKIT